MNDGTFLFILIFILSISGMAADEAVDGPVDCSVVACVGTE
jgi:hypothetical protein